MAPREDLRSRRPLMPKSQGKDAPARSRTTIVLPEALLVRPKIAAAEDRTDVSALLVRAAEEYLKARKGGRHGRT